MTSTTLRYERVRSDVDVLSRAGLTLDAFLAEAITSVQRAIAWEGACLGTHDPDTGILTSSRKYGDLIGSNHADLRFGLIEYGDEESTTFRRLVAAGVRAVGIDLYTGGEVQRSVRMEQLILPEYGFTDEARLVFLDGDRIWGGLALFRGPGDQRFEAEEIDFLTRLGPLFARGLRTGILARLGETAPARALGPAVVIVDAEDRISQVTPAAHAWLEALIPGVHSGDPYSVVSPLVSTARRFARGESDAIASARVRTAEGTWLVLQAAPLSDRDGLAREVVISIEEARPPEILSLVVASYGLTAREAEVTRLVLQGADTRQIAAALHLSAYTVQDHLKAIFDKTDVRSRRELIARVFADQYAPRLGQELTPAGEFA